MLINPFIFGIPLVKYVAFVAASGGGFITNTTIAAPVSPGTVATGDGLFAFLFARSVVTPPAGWTLIASKANTGTLTQTLYIYKKNSTSPADASTGFIWTQAVSGRMGLAYLVVRAINGTLDFSNFADAETDYASATAYPHNVTIPALAADTDNELCVMAISAEAASAVGTGNIYTVTGATVRTTQPIADGRLSVHTMGRNIGQSNPNVGTFQPDVGAPPSTNYYAAITLRLQSI